MIEHNVEISPLTTFGVPCVAKRFARFSNIEELRQILLQRGDDSLLVLGGGSNILFTKNFNGLVLLNEIKGTEIVEENSDYIIIKAGAGEVWHDFVVHCVQNNWGGIENLSLIPGSVGASPIQNIGAYGVEIKDVFEELEALEITTGEIHRFSMNECKFGYRDSLFKNEAKGHYIIISVTYRLQKNARINTRYGVIESELEKAGIVNPGISDVSEAVIAIRRSKLPDPREIGNAGSFFKNPVIEKEILQKIQENYPDVPQYPADNDHVKLAAGWLIEKAGWKGYRMGNFGVHRLQALVLVNYGGSTGEEIYDLSENIINDVYLKFGVRLEREVNIM